MFRDLVVKGKAWADKVANAVMNYSEVETKVREATSDEAWGPHPHLMRQIADYTYTHGSYLEVMCTLWKRLHTEHGYHWRRVYKSLLLLDFLLKNGAEQVAAGANEHIYDLRTLEGFQYYEDSGKDQGVNVRLKVRDIINLLQDSERLREERDKAKANRDLFTNPPSFGSNEYHGSRVHSSSPYDPPIDHRGDSLNSFRPTHVPSPTMQSSEPRLGSFDDWHVGRERGVVDEVVEQVKEAWDFAKLATKDLFGRRDSDISVNEEHPRMVSEELYTFPADAVDDDAIEYPDELGHQSDDMRWSNKPVHEPTSSQADRSRSSVTRVTKPNNSHVPRVTLKVDKQQPNLPNANGSSNPSVPSPPAVSTTLVDLESSSPQDTDWLSANGHQPSSVPSWPQSTGTGASVANVSLIDADFGDFVSAQPTNKQDQCLLDMDPPAVAPLGGAAYQPSTPQFTMLNSSWPSPGPITTSTDKLATDLFAQPALFPSNPPDTSNPMAKTPGLSSEQPQSNTVSKAQPQISDTWKELGSLKIDLDTIAVLDKHGGRSNAGPSLRQLQQQKQQGALVNPGSRTQAKY